VITSYKIRNYYRQHSVLKVGIFITFISFIIRMTSLRFPEITDELLSAYLDKAVTEEEKTLVETAIADEPAIAWRLETLRQTVTLLRTMPAVALPRSFVLSEVQLVAVAEQVDRADHRVRTPPVSARSRWTSMWLAWRAFWTVGSPLLRNAAAASFVALLFLLAGNFFLAQPQRFVAPGPSSTMAPRVAIVATPVRQATATPGSTAEAAAEIITIAAQPATPATATPMTQAMQSAEAADDAMALEAAPSPVEQPTQTSPAITAMRPPGPDEGVDFVPEGAGGDLFSEGHEPGPAIESMPPSAAAPADAERVTEESAAGAPETAVEAITEPMRSAATISESDGAMPAAPISSPVSPTVSSPVTSVVSTTVMTTTVVTTTTVSSTPATQEGAAAPASPSPQAEASADTEGGMPDPGAAVQVDALSRLEILQITLALLTVLFGMLWWRSRSTSSKSV
jgi:hypothetical protein